MSKHRLQLVCALLIASFSSVGRADPPRASHDYWRNTAYPSHYVRYDQATRTYVETVDCRPLWRFTLVSNAANTLTLYDASRGMTIQLNYDGMYLKPVGQSSFTYYQPGTFDTRTQFFHYDANGTYTGSINRRDGCVWEEWFPGSSLPAYRFRQTLVTNDAVEMYDQTRDLSVRLTRDKMYLRTGSQAYGFFKSGRWP